MIIPKIIDLLKNMDFAKSDKTVDLNRTLPKLPVQLCLDLPPKLSFKPMPRADDTDCQLVMSPVSPRIPIDAGKRQFQKVTHDLLRPSSPMENPRTCGNPDPLDPVKYSPSQVMHTPDLSSSNNSYHVYDGHDLYEDASRSQTLVEEFYQLQSASPSQKDDCVEDSMTKELSQKSRGMSQSRSDANIMYRRHPTRIDTSLDCEYSEPGNRHPASCDSFSSSSGYPSRGRFASRTPSPMKLDNINEDLEVGCSPSPPKRSRSPVKQLFGEHGWLGRSTSMKELPSDEFRKTGIKHWGGKLKQRVGEMTGDVSKLMASNIFVNYDLPKYSFPPNSQFPISLDPPAQSRFYREIELMICATANQYLMTQARAGRMTVESLQKIKQFWASKNRPQVMEFQYDQTTQRDLVLYNLKTFRFFGPNAENPVAMNAMMLAWRTLAREMSVRTFCTPDSVIRKQLHDGYKILEMLGGTPLMFLAFQQMQVTCLQIMHDEQARREGFRPKKFGVERKWEPRSEDKFKSMEMENPFA